MLCGISLLCANKATAQQKLAFTFQVRWCLGSFSLSLARSLVLSKYLSPSRPLALSPSRPLALS
eukprot:SAG22_NODE_11798_length_468_cov_1.674797_1_plen_63_part_10